MPNNNDGLFNAALAGVSGGGQERWITDSVAANYAAFRSAAVVFATAVDSAIPTIGAGVTTADAQLLQSICQGVMATRLPTSVTASDYTTVANAIAALFTEQQSSLVPVAAPGSAPAVNRMVQAGSLPPLDLADNTVAIPLTPWNTESTDDCDFTVNALFNCINGNPEIPLEFDIEVRLITSSAPLVTRTCILNLPEGATQLGLAYCGRFVRPASLLSNLAPSIEFAYTNPGVNGSIDITEIEIDFVRPPVGEQNW